ncbi:BH0509 family protein [Anaerobacillus alkaliphilus]|uniref:BH0509 family protein n=1 Tax=Anaerobacillus alkaliphilus TaxID=1548597 RepID=A0A4Q0VUA1_9BACI|nr:BH0509 family protein [Anaerobacillus alkaliphilus]RXJ01922.1 BH0509 family protein [Anaerobacillus alkaliphilus]
MSRQERKNMINFIEKMKGLDSSQLKNMTDQEVEHIYNSLYLKLVTQE